VAGFMEYVDDRLDLDQSQLFCPPDGRPAVIDIQFAVDALRVSTNRAQSNDELAGDLGTRQLGSEEAQDVQLPLAERLNWIFNF